MDSITSRRQKLGWAHGLKPLDQQEGSSLDGAKDVHEACAQIGIKHPLDPKGVPLLFLFFRAGITSYHRGCLAKWRLEEAHDLSIRGRKCAPHAKGCEVLPRCRWEESMRFQASAGKEMNSDGFTWKRRERQKGGWLEESAKTFVKSSHQKQSRGSRMRRWIQSYGSSENKLASYSYTHTYPPLPFHSNRQRQWREGEGRQMRLTWGQTWSFWRQRGRRRG